MTTGSDMETIERNAAPFGSGGVDAREVLAHLSPCVFVVSADNRVRYVNRLPMGVGHGLPQIIGQDVREALAPLVFEGTGLRAALEEVRSGSGRVRLRALRPDVARQGGDLIEIDLVPGPGQGDVILEVNDRQRAHVEHDRLERFRQFTEDILRSLGSGLVVVDMAGRVLVTNDAAAQIVESSREALLQGGLGGLLDPETAAGVLNGDYDDEAGGPYAITKPLPSGREIRLGFSVSPLYDRNGKRTGTILPFKDVTEVDALKSQMIHQEKMAALGSLAGGVAHEFNNLIGGMMGYAQLAQATQDRNEYEKCVEVVLKSSKRAKDIVQRLLTFARRPEGVKTRTRLVDLVDETLTILERSFDKQSIQVRRNFEFNGALCIDSSLLQVVILNLITNARDAMQAGGVLTVETGADATTATLRVTDTGPGIDPAQQYRVFEPFFTTKGAIGGSDVPGVGLGLSVAYGIVKGMGGEIRVNSEPGRGTSFTVSIPRQDDDATGAGVPLVKETRDGDFASAPTRQYRVLILEPDAVVRDILGKILRRMGCETTLAPDWDKAVDASRSTGFDLAFVCESADDLPNGREKREAFQLGNPNTRFVHCLGRDARPDSGELVLRKPYRYQDVIAVLMEMENVKIEDRSGEDGR